jgi:hypothetical protein
VHANKREKIFHVCVTIKNLNEKLSPIDMTMGIKKDRSKLHVYWSVYNKRGVKLKISVRFIVSEFTNTAI